MCSSAASSTSRLSFAGLQAAASQFFESLFLRGLERPSGESSERTARGLRQRVSFFIFSRFASSIFRINMILLKLSLLILTMSCFLIGSNIELLLSFFRVAEFFLCVLMVAWMVSTQSASSAFGENRVRCSLRHLMVKTPFPTTCSTLVFFKGNKQQTSRASCFGSSMVPFCRSPPRNLQYIIMSEKRMT